MAHKIGIYYNQQTLRDFVTGNKIAKMEDEIMQERLSRIKAEFRQQFGFDGDFTIKAIITKSQRARLSYRIEPNNAATTAALKRTPDWLAKFL